MSERDERLARIRRGRGRPVVRKNDLYDLQIAQIDDRLPGDPGR